jgi:hypothetical protein
MLHLALYSGFPAALNGVFSINAALAAKVVLAGRAEA